MEVAVEGDAYRHLFRAARCAIGDRVRVVDGAGRARHAVVERVDRRRASRRLGGAAPSREPRLGVELLVAPPRPSRASWLIEKGTELGVRAFRFLECERSERPLDGDDLDRLRRVARAALEQCGRSLLPEVTGPHPIDTLLDGRDHGAAAFVLDPGAATHAAQVSLGPITSAWLLIGPEGGFAPSELEVATRLGARPLRLLESLQRIEKAALAAAARALLQGETALGDASARRCNL
jgi:16S rRNA (uracil1498-N3)-methyltransferase